jgi:hypothetical protein
MHLVRVQIRTSFGDFLKVTLKYRKMSRLVKLYIGGYHRRGIAIYVRIDMHPCVIGSVITKLASIFMDDNDHDPWTVYVIAMNVHAVKMGEGNFGWALCKVVKMVEIGYRHYLPQSIDDLASKVGDSDSLVDVLARLTKLTRGHCMMHHTVPDFVQRLYAARTISRAAREYLWKPGGPLAARLLEKRMDFNRY